jgi:hypothetical protein
MKSDNIIALKAEAYDALANIEAWQNKLREINQQIAEAQKIENEKKKENE